MKLLASKGIGTRPFFHPMHQQSVLKKMGLFEGDSYPEVERMSRQGFYFPSGMALTDEQMNRTAETVWQVLA